MSTRYPLSNIKKENLDKLSSLVGVESWRIDNDSLIVEGNINKDDISSLLFINGECHECNIKAHNHSHESHVKEKNKGEWKKITLSASIDCAECAKEVEEGLNTRSDVKDAIFDFPKGKLSLTTTLSEEEVMKVSKEIEDEIEFYDNEAKRYVFSVSIDSVDNALKVEKALNDNPKVKRAKYDQRKGQLHVYSVLTEKEIMEESKKAYSEIVFHSSREEEERDLSLYRVGISIILLILSYILSNPIIAIFSYLIAGYDVLYKAFRNILKGKIFDENFLMAIATLAALFVKSHDEAAAVMVFYQIGEYFQRRATQKSRESIGKLLDLSTDKVSVKEGNEWLDKNPEDVVVGSLIRVRNGEKIALDGIVEDGMGFIDTRALTGESVPVKVKEGDKILSGSVNGDSSLIIKTTTNYSESTATKIMKLVEEGENKKAQSEKFITLFSRYYTPLVCLSALLFAIIPPLFGVSWSDSIYRASMLLVISCPCALVLSVPLTYFASMGAYAKNGILTKGDDAIQKLSKVEYVAMDKTGTLTEGVFSVQKIEHLSTDKEHLIGVVKAIETGSTHPIALSLLQLEGGEKLKGENIKTIPSVGIEGIVNGKKVIVGSIKIAPNLPRIDQEGTHIYVVEEGKLLGVFIISDKLRDNAKEVIKEMKRIGVKETYILSGDRNERVRKTSESLGIDGYYGELLPVDKMNKVDELKKKGILAYVGDGINDAPTLLRADVGIAMGGIGSDSAIEASDCVIMDDDISKLPVAIYIARKTEKIVKENIIFSLAVKALVFILAGMGIANMWLAVIADTGVSLIAVMNALRALKYKIK